MPSFKAKARTKDMQACRDMNSAGTDLLAHGAWSMITVIHPSHAKMKSILFSKYIRTWTALC